MHRISTTHCPIMAQWFFRTFPQRSRQWYVAMVELSRCLNQYWNIIHWTPANKLNWILIFNEMFDHICREWSYPLCPRASLCPWILNFSMWNQFQSAPRAVLTCRWSPRWINLSQIQHHAGKKIKLAYGNPEQRTTFSDLCKWMLLFTLLLR